MLVVILTITILQNCYYVSVVILLQWALDTGYEIQVDMPL